MNGRAHVASLEETAVALGIESLVHFTPIENLTGILMLGLRTRHELQALPPERRPVFPDDARLDGRPDHISFSIGFPNWRLFFRKRVERIPERSPRRDAAWAVLTVSPALLWERPCLIFPSNAARFPPWKARAARFRGPEALARAFAGPPDQRRPGWPPNPQAEVLVPGPVALEAVSGVHFPTAEAGNRYIRDHQALLRDVPEPPFFATGSFWAQRPGD